MLSRLLPNGTRTWTAPNGELRLWKPASHVLVLRFRGALFEAEFARVAVTLIEEFASSNLGKLHIFHDWEEMKLYTTEARTELTELGLRLMPRLDSLNVLFSSSVVEMGVTMASITLGGIRMFNRREAFEQAIQRAVESRGGTYTPLPPE